MKGYTVLRTLAMVVLMVPPSVACMAEGPEPENKAVPEYGYRVVSQKRFDRQNFTQGLEIHDGRLYVSSGLYGESMLRAYDLSLIHI